MAEIDDVYRRAARLNAELDPVRAPKTLDEAGLTELEAIRFRLREVLNRFQFSSRGIQELSRLKEAIEELEARASAPLRRAILPDDSSGPAVLPEMPAQASQPLPAAPEHQAPHQEAQAEPFQAAQPQAAAAFPSWPAAAPRPRRSTPPYPQENQPLTARGGGRIRSILNLAAAIYVLGFFCAFIYFTYDQWPSHTGWSFLTQVLFQAVIKALTWPVLFW